MLRKSILAVLFIALLLMFNACKDEIATPNTQMSEQQSVQKSLASVQGSLVSVNRIRLNDDGLFEVKVVTPLGAMIKFEYFESTGQVREIQGLTGPFEYDLDPGNGLMLYQNVRVIVLNAKQGDIISWKLQKDESDNKWEYRFFISATDGNWELRINAVNGQISRIKK